MLFCTLVSFQVHVCAPSVPFPNSFLVFQVIKSFVSNLYFSLFSWHMHFMIVRGFFGQDVIFSCRVV